jgi:hypothetical protein
MTAILIRFGVCLAILAVVVITLALIGCISPGPGNRMTRVLMFSSLKEANRAAVIAAWELQDSGLVTGPRYVTEINRYFVVIEQVPPHERLVPGEWPHESRCED